MRRVKKLENFLRGFSKIYIIAAKKINRLKLKFFKNVHIKLNSYKLLSC